MQKLILITSIMISLVYNQCEKSKCFKCSPEGKCQLCYSQFYLLQGNCINKPDEQIRGQDLNFDGIGGQIDRFPRTMPKQFTITQLRDTGSASINQNQPMNLDAQNFKRSEKFGCFIEFNDDCILCSEGYQLKDRKCIEMKNYKCIESDDKGYCLKCADTLYLSDSGNCVDKKCDIGNYYSCQVCRTGFTLDDSGVCIDQNCVQYSQGSCSKCKINMNPEFKNNDLCIKKNNCKASYQEQDQIICTSCISGYQLSSGKCLDPCISKNSETNECQQCIKEYILSPTKKCVQSSEFCKISYFQDQLVRCRVCKTEYILTIQHTCQRSEILVISPDKVNPCQAYDQNFICNNCLGGFTLAKQRTTCFKETLNCIQYKQTVCNKCAEGYRLTSKNLCVNGQNCKITRNNSQCVSCNSGYYLKDEGCFLNDPLCKQISNGNCTNCYDGYTLTKGKCIQSTDYENCLQIVDGRCLKCIQNYQLIDNRCHSLVVNCQKFNQNARKCEKCYVGYILKDGQCKIDDNFEERSDLKCKSFNKITQKCLQCYPQYFLVANGCQKADSLCKTFNNIGGVCLSCYDGYTLFNGKCTIGKIGTDNCQNYDEKSQSCQNCSDRFYKNQNGKCLPVSDQCQTYNTTTGKCLTCYEGYRLISGSCSAFTDPNCKEPDPTSNNNCLSCIDRYFISKQGKCVPVPLQCNRYNSDGTCIDCINSYIFFEGSCVQPSLGKDNHCQFYQRRNQNIYCKQCYPGYEIIQFKCQKSQ